MNTTKIKEQIDKLPICTEGKKAVTELLSTVISEITGKPADLNPRELITSIEAGDRFRMDGQSEIVTLVDISNLSYTVKEIQPVENKWAIGGLNGNASSLFNHEPSSTREMLKYLNKSWYKLGRYELVP